MNINFIVIVATLQSTELNSGLSHRNCKLTYEKVKELILFKRLASLHSKFSTILAFYGLFHTKLGNHI